MDITNSEKVSEIMNISLTVHKNGRNYTVEVSVGCNHRSMEMESEIVTVIDDNEELITAQRAFTDEEQREIFEAAKSTF